MAGFTQFAVFKALGWALFDSLWQMAILCLCYILVVSVFKKASPGSRHGLSIILLSLGAVWFCISLVMHDIPATEKTGSWIWPERVISSLASWAKPSGLGRMMGIIDQCVSYASLLYLTILFILTARYAHFYIYARRLKEEDIFTIHPELLAFAQKAARRMGIKKVVRIWRSRRVEVPMTMGFLRPVILLPFAMVNQLSIEQAESILLHELAHIKRNDYLVNLLVTAFQLLFFFNPFTRMLIRDLKKEREHRCDDVVMQFRYDPRAYVSALLSLATHSRHRQQALALAATGKNNRFLLQRVQRLLQQKQSPDRPNIRPVLFLLLFTVIAGLHMVIHPVKDAGPQRDVLILSRIPVYLDEVTAPDTGVSSATTGQTGPKTATTTPQADRGQDSIDMPPAGPESIRPGPDPIEKLSDTDPPTADENNDQDDSMISIGDVTTLLQQNLKQAEGAIVNPNAVINIDLSQIQTSAATAGKRLKDPSFSFRWIEDTLAKKAKDLTVAESKAGIQRARILRAMALNKVIIEKIENELQTPDQRHDQIMIRRDLLQKQQVEQKKMVKEIKRLTIVYI